MGFSYSKFGLCCDFCGNSSPEFNVKKINCPYGFCQAWACCKNCQAKKLHLRSSCVKNGELNHKDYCKHAVIKYNSEAKFLIMENILT